MTQSLNPRVGQYPVTCLACSKSTIETLEQGVKSAQG